MNTYDVYWFRHGTGVCKLQVRAEDFFSNDQCLKFTHGKEIVATFQWNAILGVCPEVDERDIRYSILLKNAEAPISISHGESVGDQKEEKKGRLAFSTGDKHFAVFRMDSFVYFNDVRNSGFISFS